jgi:DNA polymerase elongation subunit (family B)
MAFYTCVETRGSKILYRGVENGIRVQREVSFDPILFVPSTKPSEWKTLAGQPLQALSPGNMYECREFIEKYDGVSGFEIYGQTDFIYQFISKEFPEEISYNEREIVTAFIDIETTCEDGFPQISSPTEKVIAITVRLGAKSYVFGLGKFKIDLPNVKCQEYDDERQLLEDFLIFWESHSPDIITGWNVRFFDIPYLYNRINYILGEEEAARLSPFNRVIEKVIQSATRGPQKCYDIMGISTLDYYELYNKFTYTKQESYRLDYIASVELGERKLSYDEYDNLKEFYKNDFNKFVHYNHHDVELVYKLEQKMKLIELVLAVAYSAKVNYEDVFSQVRTWDTIIYNELLKDKIVIPKKKSAVKEQQYEGAYVKEPILGMNDWIVSFDLNSLYPHLIMQYNLSPETICSDSYFFRGGLTPIRVLNNTPEAQTYTNEAKKKNICVASNGLGLRKDIQGFLPRLMEKMYAERSQYKKKMIECQKKLESKNITEEERTELEFLVAKYNNFQMARKIQLNSAYGAVGNEYFRYYDESIAEAITLSGQLSIRWIENKINEFLNKMLKSEFDYVVASDTDSIYINMGPLVQRLVKDKSTEDIVTYLDKCCKEIIEPYIKKCYDELANYMNAYANKMFMKRESIASKGIWTAKKRYMLLVHDSEGVRYAKPKTKIMGIETTRSSTPQVVREELKKCIDIILTKDNDTLIKHIDEFRKKFKNFDPEDIAFPRSVNGVKDYTDSSRIYKKGTPIAVKGALLYNYYINKAKLQKKYQIIRDADKIKFLYLKTPNPVGGLTGKDCVISFMNSLPKEFDLNAYIDYDTQFEKAFLDPLKAIVEAIGWQTERRNTLEAMFS